VVCPKTHGALGSCHREVVGSAVAVLATVRFSTELPPAVTLAGLRLTVTPYGRGLMVRERSNPGRIGFRFGAVKEDRDGGGSVEPRWSHAVTKPSVGGTSYFAAVRQLAKMARTNVPVTSVAPVPYWQQEFAGLGPRCASRWGL
jgi:hypothetical protein